MIIKEFKKLKIGDYIAHIDYGIGKFLGLQQIVANGILKECIKISFLNDDILYISIHALHKITPINLQNGIPPKLTKLGSTSWEELKIKTKKKVQKIAFDLIKLYAKRKSLQGFSFSPDSFLQKQLESEFQYQETDDQSHAIKEIKKDMENNKPMDRLICGDVGFGKTEIAIRAAFKAVCDFKQVVVLVPTTILAFQHYYSFLNRLNNFNNVKIDYLTRYRNNKEKNQIIYDVKKGNINILIGTHQVISSLIEYKDLGLLIIDEEHKFGVEIKDKLKIFKSNLDILTLTATPIPRTLEFSLASVRDISIIKTPPSNRKPINTSIQEFNKHFIYNAILYELSRNGQVFFIDNRIENLTKIVRIIKNLFPLAKIEIGHGQLPGKKLEKIFLDFIGKKFDIFVCTTIVESGLNISNANTIFINNAHYLGLADLHQLRGRVGRSNKQGFCYLLVPSINSLSIETRNRLEIMQLYSNLGSGFEISMKDLEIRGAGNLLGPEQSGLINGMGFEMYQKILTETIQEVKINNFSNFFSEEIKKKNFIINEVRIESDFELLIPDNYINKVEDRLFFYRYLAKAENENHLKNIEKELINNFGVLPQSVKNLFTFTQIKWMCKKIGFEKLIINKGIVLAYFPESNSKYFASSTFIKILQFCSNFSSDISLKEKNTKKGKFLSLQKRNIQSINKLYFFLEKIILFI